MKIAKASEKEVDTIFEILTALESISNGEMPGEENEEINIGWSNLQEALDAEKDDYVSDKDNYFIRQALKYLLYANQEQYALRAAGNLAALMDPANNIIDQTASTLELSPQIQQGLADTARMDWLADPCQQIGNIILPTSCVTANLDNMRAAIDCAMRMHQKEPQTS